jgi:nucleotide-binding universal stress UspA family protein
MRSESGKTSAVKVFTSYAHEDDRFRVKLHKNLSTMTRQKLIENWDDQQIKAGDKRVQEVLKHLEEAEIILCLLSPDFICTDDLYEGEARRALERQAAGEAAVIPILVRSVDWEKTLFGELQILPRDKKPIEESTRPGRAYTQVVVEVERVVQEIQARRRKA